MMEIITYWLDPSDGEIFADDERPHIWRKDSPEELRKLGFRPFDEVSREELLKAILYLYRQLQHAYESN